MSRTHRIASSLLSITAAAAMAFSAGPAQAAPAKTAATVVCTGGQTQTYSPPLGPLPRDTLVGLDEQLTCLGGPFVTGVGSASFVQQSSCLLPPPMATILPPYAITYHWSDGQTSTITYTLTAVVQLANQNVVTATGTVTSGYAQGSIAERQVTTLDLDVLSCLASSTDEQHGSEILTILL